MGNSLKMVPDIRSLSLEELNDFFVQQGEKKFRAKQVYEWLWRKNALSFAMMTNLPESLRQMLQEHFQLSHIQIKREQISKDTTRKYLLQLADGNQIEMVLIPSKDRITVCISSQVGCAMACKFCATGALGFKRNLSVAEIYEQVYLANQLAQQHFNHTLSNIVIMGMGEPLLNYEHINRSLQIITGKEGMEMSPSRITLSTVGICEGIKKLAIDQPNIGLAVSLHCAWQNKREQIMPIAYGNTLEQLTDALKYYYKQTGQRITFEYLLLAGINDSLADAKKLAHYCLDFPVKINVIEYNQNEKLTFKHSSAEDRDRFIAFLESKNLLVQLRYSKGQDIDAACGQLANKYKNR